MRKVYQAIVLIKNFATGIMAPVLTLALMARGASIGEISLLLGAYSFTVIAAEFPSGVYADLRGRKRAFLLSAALYGLCYGLLLLAYSTAVLFCAMVACGLGRAFSSGSLEALAIDEAVAGEEVEQGGALVRVTARLSILESAGLAAGSLAGGFMAGLMAGYRVNLAVNLTLYVLLFFLTLFCVRESPRPRAEMGGKRAGALESVGAQVRESLKFMARPGAVRMLFALSMITGFALIGLETYWQPALSRLTPASWVFGAVSFAGFFSVMLGSRITQRLILKRRDGGVKLLLGMKALAGVCLLLLAVQTHTPLFALVYLLAYLSLGGGGVVESALLNRAAPGRQRASILSLFSFVMQIGGLIASLCGYLVSARADFTALWCLSGALMILGAGAFLWTRADR